MGNLEHRIIYVNEAFVRMFGYSREELIGKEIDFIYPEEEIEKKVLRSERLATIGEFSGGVAHELKQPLGVINNAAYFLGIMLKDIADEKVKQYLGILEKEVKRANRMINQVVEEALSEVDIPANIELKKELKEDLTAIHADFDQIQRTCMNIITNAISVMPEGGSLGIKTEENKEEGNIEIIISDTGEGISGE